MRVIEIGERFGLEGLRVAERPDPEPGPGQVAVRIRAASLNFRDLLMVRGHYDPRQPLPLIPCSDGAGEVTAIGDGVRTVSPGDRVATLFAQDWVSGEPTAARLRSTLGGPRDGTLAETVVLAEHGVVPLPQHLTFDEGATLTCAALTAWSALVEHGRLTAGQTVLIQGTGGVSIFALQFAKMIGARSIVTSSSDAKLERARELGASETLNYKDTPEWGRPVRELTGGEGVDLVVEVGGAGTLAQSLSAVRMGGRVALIGVLSGIASELNVLPILMKQVRVQGVFVGHRDGFVAMNHAIETAEMRPVVDRVFPFDEVPAAFEHMAAGRHFGKICVNL